MAPPPFPLTIQQGVFDSSGWAVNQKTIFPSIVIVESKSGPPYWLPATNPTIVEYAKGGIFISQLLSPKVKLIPQALNHELSYTVLGGRYLLIRDEYNGKSLTREVSVFNLSTWSLVSALKVAVKTTDAHAAVSPSQGNGVVFLVYVFDGSNYYAPIRICRSNNGAMLCELNAPFPPGHLLLGNFDGSNLLIQDGSTDSVQKTCPQTAELKAKPYVRKPLKRHSGR